MGFKDALKKFVTSGGLYKLINTGCNVVKDINEGVLGKDGILEKMGVVHNDGDIRGLYNGGGLINEGYIKNMQDYVSYVAEKCGMILSQNDKTDQGAISMLQKIYQNFNKLLPFNDKNDVNVVEKKNEINLQVKPGESIVKVSSPSRLYNSLVENGNTCAAVNLGQIETLQYNNSSDNSGVSCQTCLLPNTINKFWDSKNYEVLDSTLINASSPEAGEILSTQEVNIKMNSVDHGLKLKLKVLHNLTEEEFQDFKKQISIIWNLKGGNGDNTGNIYVENVESTIQEPEPNEILKQKSLILAQDQNGNLSTNYKDDEINQFSANPKGFIIHNGGNTTQNVKVISDNYGLQTQTNTIGAVKSSYDKDPEKKYYFSFVTEKELINLALIYKNDKKNLKAKILECAYKHRHCRNYLPVFKNGVLHRFIERNEIENLEQDEEYEENEVHFVF